MAARENQGLLIAVIILVLVSLVLALAAFLGLSKANENADIRASLEKELNFTKKLQQAYEIEADILKACVGDINGPSVAEVPAQLSQLKNLGQGLESNEQTQIRAIADRVQQIKDTYDKDMVGSTNSAEGAEAQTTPTWREKIRNLTALVAKQVNEFNVQVAETRRSEKEAEVEIQGMKDTLAANQKTMAALNDDLQAVKQQALVDKKKLEEQLDAASATVAERSRAYSDLQEDLTSKIDDKVAALNEIQKSNDDLKVRINRYEREVYDRPDGEILNVSSGLRTVFIDLGTTDGLANNRTFSVYDRSVTKFEKDPMQVILKQWNRLGPQQFVSWISENGDYLQDLRDTAKAKIEVVKVYPFRAEARITYEDPTNPILPGDHILTATWDPGYSVSVAMAGAFDLDGDIYDDSDKLAQMIKRNGGTVVARHDENGNIEGKLDPTTRYLVIGDLPIAGENAVNPEAARQIANAMKEMEAQAEKNTIQVISLQKLLNRMGVRARPKTIQLEERIGGFPARKPADASGTLKSSDR